jgi:hypothetical protein
MELSAMPQGFDPAQIAALAAGELKRIITPVPLPRTGFDARLAADTELRDFRLPPRPDALRTPRLRAYWDWLFSTPPRFVVPEYGATTPVFHATASDSGEGAFTSTGGFGGRWGTSRNWSSAVIAARDGKLFTSAVAEWQVPEAKLPPNIGAGAIAALPGGRLQCSAWVGLDGYRLCSRSLPQVGTASLIDAQGVSRHYLWVQWWVRGKFFGEAPIHNFPVAAGDRIGATITVVSPTNVSFFVKNARTGMAITVDWASGTYTGDMNGKIKPENDPRVRTDAPVEGRHAVFAIERPSVMPPASVLGTIRPDEVESFTLPDFGRGIFAQALAEMRAPDGNPESAEERDLTAARWLRMIAPALTRQPPRVHFAAKPRAPAQAGSAGLDVGFVASP